DPIFWREYLLPWRGSRAPAILIHARYLWILLRGTMWLLLQMLMQSISIAVPLAILIGVGTYAFRAFSELFTQRSFTGGVYDQRDAFNLCIRLVSAMIGLFPVMAAPSSLSELFNRERDKKTWESLLTTSLTGSDIIGSKTRVVTRGVWSSVRWLIPVWLL